MTFEKVSEFYKRAVEEKRFSEDFLAEAKSISSEDKLRNFFSEKVLPIAQNMGYDFTADDLIAYERQVIRKLSEEELENITGGISLRGISTAFLSLLMITSNIQPMSNAMLPRDVIIESANLITGKSSSVAQTVAKESNGVAAASALAEQAVGMDRSVVVDSTEPCKSLRSGYVFKALNLLDPYALKMSGATQDMRFFDGNTTGLKVYGDVQEGSIPRRKYNEDQGEGSPNYMRTLFPSSAGDLSAFGGYDKFARFSADCNPSPELVARIAAYFYEFRNVLNKDEMKNQLSECVNILKKASDVTDEKLSDRFYEVLRSYKKVSTEYDKVKDSSMTVQQYIEAFINGSNKYKISGKLFENIGSIFSKKYGSDTKYQPIIEKIKAEIALDDEEYKIVLGDIAVNKKLYGEVMKDFADALKGQKANITFETFVARKGESVRYKEEICKINARKDDYKKLLELLKSKNQSPDERNKIWDEVKSNPDLFQVCMSGDEISARKDLEKVYEFFVSKNMKDDMVSEEFKENPKEYIKTNAGMKKAKAILTLLKEGTYMIEEQEVSEDEIAEDASKEDKGTESKYPKYTTERMLMSYFIEQFNVSDDVKRFYDEIDKLISPDENMGDTSAKDRLNIISKVIEEMPINANVPLAYAGGGLNNQWSNQDNI